MAKSTKVLFTCPNCSALYQVVKAEAGPETTDDPEVMCRICGAPLPAREDQWIVKYFLLRKASRREIWKRKLPTPML
jgi:predicted Zn finger-like uncharacterized protein